jgi:hypothetical protein
VANLETLISVTGDLSYDETLNPQTQTGFPTVGDDADDDNVANLAALTAAYSARLFNSIANGGLGLSTAAVDGQATTQLLTINNGAGLTDLGFAASDGSVLSGQTSGLFTTGGKEVFLFSDTDNNIVLGKYDSNGDTVPDTVAFVLVLEEIKNNSGVVTGGKVWTIAFEALNHTENPLDPTDHDNVIDLTDKLFVKASQEVVFGSFDDAPANQNAWTPIDNNPNSTSDIQLLVTGLNLVAQDAANDSYGDSVNTRATSLGSGSQSVTNGKALRFDFVTGIQTPIDNTAADFTQSIAYGDHSEISGAGVSIVQSTPTSTRLDIEVSIFDVQADTATGNDFVDGLEIYDAANNVEVDIQSVQIIRELNNGTLQTVEWRDKDGNLVGNSPDNASLTLTITGNTVLVDGLLTSGWGNSPTSTKGYQILVRAANGDVFDRMVVKNVGDDQGDGSFDLGGFRILDANTDIDEVGSRINFDDDGPSVTAVTDTTASVTHDETPGLQNATATPTPASRHG